MVIKFIYGMSGCAKTTTAIKSLKNVASFACIAFTHSAVNNLKNIYNELFNNIPPDSFLTIHKFLRIPIKDNGEYTIIRHKHIKYIRKIILIDEFSLIPLDIIDYLFEIASNSDSTFIFIGDFVQLMPISKIKQPINTSLINSDFKNINMTFNEAMKIAEHLSNSVYTSKYFKNADKMVLLHNYRNGDKVNMILNDALNGNFDNYIIQNFDIKKYVNEGYIILSSMYKYLELAYNFAISEVDNKDLNIKKTKIGRIIINKNDKLVLMDNISENFVNGDEVYVKDIKKHNEIEVCKINDNESIIIDAYKVLPYNFITCHKAQGRSIPKVLLILDDLFEITMLYTAITRAKEDIKFIKFNNCPEISDINAFKIMRDVIYKKND